MATVRLTFRALKTSHNSKHKLRTIRTITNIVNSAVRLSAFKIKLKLTLNSCGIQNLEANNEQNDSINIPKNYCIDCKQPSQKYKI